MKTYSHIMMFTTRHEWLLIRPRDVLVSKPLLRPETSSQPDHVDDDDNCDDVAADVDTDNGADDNAIKKICLLTHTKSLISTQVKIPTKCSQSQIPALGCVTTSCYYFIILLSLS